MYIRLTFFIVFTLTGLDTAMSQNKTVPEIRFADFQRYLNSHSDSVFVINFWATWCAPCRKELPEFEKIHHDFSGKNVKVILVSLDFPDQAKKSLQQFLSAQHITIPVVLLNEPDANSWIDKVDPQWSGALPATLIYRKNERKFFDKELTYTEISNSIISLTN